MPNGTRKLGIEVGCIVLYHSKRVSYKENQIHGSYSKFISMKSTVIVRCNE